MKNYKRKVILLYSWFNTADSMEDNNDMPSASTSKTQPIGETGEEISELTPTFGDDDGNDITQGD